MREYSVDVVSKGGVSKIFLHQQPRLSDGSPRFILESSMLGGSAWRFCTRLSLWKGAFKKLETVLSGLFADDGVESVCTEWWDDE